MTDIAKRAGVDVATFQAWLTREDWHAIIDLGWQPYKRKLMPPVVSYLMDKFLPNYDTAKK